MAKNITFSNFDLQTSYFRTKNIIYRNLPNKNIDLEPNSRRDGFRLIDTYYNLKDIVISGTLTRDTEANLKTSLDSMKEALYVDEANLDIDDGSGTIRYVCSVESIRVPEEHYNITQIPYNITFRCQPFGKTTTSTNDSKTITNASTVPYTSTVDPVGSAPPLPILKWTCSGAPTAAITQIIFENTTTTDLITVGSLNLILNNDYLEIDCDAMTVKAVQNGGAEAEIDFTGVFPKFEATSNSYKVTITGGGATWTLDQDIDYYSTYL